MADNPTVLSRIEWGFGVNVANMRVARKMTSVSPSNQVMSVPTQQTVQAMHQASALLQAGQYAQARSLLESAVQTDPQFVEARRLLAGARQAMGDVAGAKRELTDAIRINPRWAPLHTALGELLAAENNWAEAEQCLRTAVSVGSNYPRARLSLARLLLQTGRAQAAHDLLAEQAASSLAGVELLNEYASTLFALNRYDDAATVLARACRMEPRNGTLETRLAAAESSAGHYARAAQTIKRAMQKGADYAQTWFLAGHAAVGEDRFEDAENAFRQACRRNPEYLDAQRELAQLIWMRHGDLAASTAVLDATLNERPNLKNLLAIKAALYRHAGHEAQAFAMLRDAARDPDAGPQLLLPASELAIRADSGEAVEFAERAYRLAPRDPHVASTLGGALLHAGRGTEAERLAREALSHNPHDQGLIALLASAQRLQGNERYRDIYDYPGLVRPWQIDTPDGWLDLPAYLSDLACSLRRLHKLHRHPLQQSLSNGTQTTQNLMEVDDPAIRAFFKAIDGPIRHHIQAIGHGEDPTRKRNTGGYRLHSIWSVQLQPNGYHVNHVHPDGWLSSACYIDLPPAIQRDREGWLKFGEPGSATKPPLPPEHFVKPEPGLLALFPSHMWHGTVPFTGDGTRLTIAFDILPA